MWINEGHGDGIIVKNKTFVCASDQERGLISTNKISLYTRSVKAQKYTIQFANPLYIGQVIEIDDIYVQTNGLSF